jgi:hypothetical protein
MLARQSERDEFHGPLLGMWLQMKPGPLKGSNGGGIARVDSGPPFLETIELRRGCDGLFDGLATVTATAVIGSESDADDSDPVRPRLTPRVSDSPAVKQDNEHQFG